MTLRPSLLRSRCIYDRTVCVSTSRNVVLRERFFSRTYETRYGLRVVVKTIMEMERVRRSS